ncbi:Chitin biosynthesis protein CHS6 [Nakaseomyces bracarensis]|uniref:Chitin biosynthesis protein CHS6 n=1 Tax=Nakaseomyces bracarensis TaxID=273131 RepID=A0ABR4NUU0_9SACH
MFWSGKKKKTKKEDVDVNKSDDGLPVRRSTSNNVYLTPTKNAHGRNRSIDEIPGEGNRNNSNLTLPNLEQTNSRSKSRSASFSGPQKNSVYNNGKYTGSTPNLLDKTGKKREFPRVMEHQFGESLGLRTTLLKRLVKQGKLGLGPPDLVHITAYDTYHKDIETGQYFYLTGLDVSDESMAIALLKLLKQESTDQVISTYCCTNFFSQVDIRIRVETDKNYQINAVDCSNGSTLIQLSEQIWEETFVSACVRSVITNIETARKLPGLVEYPLLGLTQGSSSNDIAKCEHILSLLCKYLPHFLECGWDSTMSLEPTIISNYLTRSILEFLSISSPRLVTFVIDELHHLMNRDESNGIIYQIVLAAVMEQSGEHDHDLVLLLHKNIAELTDLLENKNKHDFDDLFILNSLSELLIIQGQYLLGRTTDYETALQVIKSSTEMTVDSFKSWYWLTKAYIKLGKFDKALLAINSMHPLPTIDSVRETLYMDPSMTNYYKRPLGRTNVKDQNNISENCELTSKELNNLNSKWKNQEEFQKFIFGRIYMPYNLTEKGYIPEIWEQAAYEIGPLYGTQAVNLTNFVSPHEVECVADYNLLSRNTVTKQNNWFQTQVYDLIMEIIYNLGWNELMKQRSQVFVMQQEYMVMTNEGDGRTISNLESQATVPLQFRKKRLCERWLDKMFLNIYDDLKISRAAVNNKDVKYSGLEWELLGLTMYRTWQWSDAIACLRTSIVARFDIVSCTKILELYMNDNKFEMVQSMDGVESLLNQDVVIDLLVKKISYEFRFYNEFQLLNVKILFKLSEKYGTDLLRTHVLGLPYANRGLLSVLEIMFDWVDSMELSPE